MKVLTSLAAALVAVALISCTKQEAAKAEKAVEKVAAEAKGAAESAAKELEAREVAIDAYIYAYPLVTMEMTRRVLTNVEKAEGSKAPMGHFARLRNYPAVDDHAVTAPNADTLYTLTWLDVTNPPSLAGGLFTVTNPMSSPAQFFRLRKPEPGPRN